MASEEAALASPTSHRLPTVSASQALQTLHVRGARSISTGLTQLDKALAPPSLPGHDVPGGYTRGKVTEIFGPSGVGKTAFGIQAAVAALRERQHVIWIDAACAPLVKQRFDAVYTTINRGAPRSTDPTSSKSTPDDASNRFHYFAAPSLAHVLALFMHAPASFPPKHTSLVIIDSIATVVDNAYPRYDDRTKSKTEQIRWAEKRRFVVINDLILALTKFAAVHDVALLVTCQTNARMRGPSRALLVPAISGVEWENGISTRLVLFRDWVRQAKVNDSFDADGLRKARFAGLIKANGTVLTEGGGVGTVVPFTMEDSGLCDISITSDDIAAPVLDSSYVRPLKRTLAEDEDNTGEEPNSDELYGWIEDDEVAAEGLLIDEEPFVGDSQMATTRLDVVADGHIKKVARTAV